MTKILCLVIKIDQCLQFYIYVLANFPRPKESGSFYNSVVFCCVRSLFQHCSSCDALFRNGFYVYAPLRVMIRCVRTAGCVRVRSLPLSLTLTQPAYTAPSAKS